MRRSYAIVPILLLSALHAVAQPLIARRAWYETSIDSSFISFRFETPPATTFNFYVADQLGTYQRVYADSDGRMTHDITYRLFYPATTFGIRAIAIQHALRDTVSFYTSTASPGASSGQVQIYFNRSIDSTTYPQLPKPTAANADLLEVLHQRILATKHSIDLALYSFNDSVALKVARWLAVAKQRGVSVRFIGDSDRIANSYVYPFLAPYGIPAITNGFGHSHALWSNIHHNKFILFDARADDARDAWVMTGSWNLTEQQTLTDYQNVICIQDLALARAYEREFEEEWGSSIDSPDAFHSSFSTDKTDNTPRSFVVGGREMHLFFSPKGGIESAILDRIAHATSSIELALYSFTNASLGLALTSQHDHGVSVMGVIGTGGTSDETSSLHNAGLDLLHFSGYLGFDTLFHHKYAIFDPNTTDAWTVTGSYNWTASAEKVNNENVIFIKDRAISAIYFQEWLARYHENGGTKAVLLPAAAIGTANPAPTLLNAQFRESALSLTWRSAEEGEASVMLIDMLGRTILNKPIVFASSHADLPVPNRLPSGTYFVSVRQGNRYSIDRVQRLRSDIR